MPAWGWFVLLGGIGVIVAVGYHAEQSKKQRAAFNSGGS